MPSFSSHRLPEASQQVREDIVHQLAEPMRMARLSPHAAKVVMAIRLIALCSARRHDPVGELTCRIGSVPAARALLDLADVAGTCWPESVRVLRPCCCTLSPDEATFAGMADAAARADRAAFDEVLAGFIRPDRHERLFDKAVEAVARLP